ncbi:MAG: molybdopterin-dependent oxidoreductase [Rhizobiaceae bacterium]
MKVAILGALALLLFTPAASIAEERSAAGAIALTGESVSAGPLTLTELATYPSVEQDVRFQTSKGEEAARYRGVLLWAVLEARFGESMKGHNAALAHTFVVEGSDGYRIAFSFGEIAPDFGKAPILIATEVDGKPLVPGEGFRLVVPGDKRGARYVKDVVRIEVQ